MDYSTRVDTDDSKWRRRFDTSAPANPYAEKLLADFDFDFDFVEILQRGHVRVNSTQ